MSCQILRLKWTKFDFGARLGTLHHSPRPTRWLGGAYCTSKGENRREGKGRGGGSEKKGKGGEGALYNEFLATPVVSMTDGAGVTFDRATYNHVRCVLAQDM